jgi:hypothetical protein
MHYLPLPRRVVPIVAAATVTIMIVLAWGSFRNPEALWAPGDLSRYHAQVTRCTSCHEPFQGAVSARCIVCHSTLSFAERSPLPTRTFHDEVIKGQKSCLACHTEHRH